MKAVLPMSFRTDPQLLLLSVSACYTDRVELHAPARILDLPNPFFVSCHLLVLRWKRGPVGVRAVATVA